MYGAVPYLMSAFGLDRNAAFAVVCEWLDCQSETVPARPNFPQPQAAGHRSKPLSTGQAGRRQRTM